MIGNDVVDLTLAKTQSNWQRKGFLEKQFTQEEQYVILNSEDPFTQVWLFWSMKEAAYKCYIQEHQKRFFSPKKISCKKITETKGIATIKNQKYDIDYCLLDNYIYSIAVKKSKDKMVSAVFFNSKKEAQTKIIQDKIQALFPYKVEVKKNEIGIPYLYSDTKQLPFSMSKTHHGNYAAFVIAPSL